MSFVFDVLFQDEHFVVIDKPEGFHVHQPEWRGVKAKPELVVLQQLRDQLGVHLYPVHRLDVPTSGCLLMAMNSKIASIISKQIMSQKFHKTYIGVVRGWPKDFLEITLPLESEDKTKLLEAHTKLRRIHSIEIPEPVGIRHTTARYSIVELEPLTGRFHQLRRHLNRISHPLVGDVMHGDRHHNHFFSERLFINGLCLRASQLKFEHPVSGQTVEIKAPLNTKWKHVFEVFNAQQIID
jgi:tRNA pseudouridine65 synthase